MIIKVANHIGKTFCYCFECNKKYHFCEHKHLNLKKKKTHAAKGETVLATSFDWGEGRVDK